VKGTGRNMAGAAQQGVMSPQQTRQDAPGTAISPLVTPNQGWKWNEPFGSSFLGAGTLAQRHTGGTHWQDSPSALVNKSFTWAREAPSKYATPTWK